MRVSIPHIGLTLGLSLAMLGLSPHGVYGADYEIKMVNKGPERAMQFDPQLLKISPGDTVHFVAADKGHDVESIPGMIPDGAEPFAGKMNEDLSVTLTTPGVYGYHCKPHAALGMVGLIVVGTPVNEEAAKDVSTPGLAHQIFAKLFQALDGEKSARN